MRTTPVIGRFRRGVVTVAEARAAGWTADALSAAVRRGDLVRLRRGIYAPASCGDVAPARRRDIELARRSIAASLASPAVVVSGLAMSELYEWPVWAPRPRSCGTVTDGRSRAPGVHVHRTPLPDAPVTVDGFRVTRPTRTVVDIACEFGTEAGLVAADAAMARGLTTPARLSRAVELGAGRSGIDAARPLPDLVDAEAESPLESRSRWQFVVHDLPAPRSQRWIYDLEGHVLGRSDFLWEIGVVGEVDGGEKVTDPAARAAYLRRQHLLDRVQLRKVRWGARDLATFGPTAAWIREELAAAAADTRPRLWIASPRQLGSEFAVRALIAANSDPSRRGRDVRVRGA